MTGHETGKEYKLYVSDIEKSKHIVVVVNLLLILLHCFIGLLTFHNYWGGILSHTA